MTTRISTSDFARIAKRVATLSIGTTECTPAAAAIEILRRFEVAHGAVDFDSANTIYAIALSACIVEFASREAAGNRAAEAVREFLEAETVALAALARRCGLSV